MKSNALIKLMVVALLTIAMIVPAQANDRQKDRNQKKSVVLNMEKPIIDYLAKILGDQMEADDVYRVQRFLGKIDHVTISFTDVDAEDYVLVFKELNDQQLEAWMFEEGYLSEPAESLPVEPWMTDLSYLE